MSDYYLFPKKNRIVINHKGNRSAEKILLHELDHAVRKGILKDGGTAYFAEAISGIDEKSLEKIASTYENVESDVTQLELMLDEAKAYFAETVFANKNVLESMQYEDGIIINLYLQFPQPIAIAFIRAKFQLN